VPKPATGTRIKLTADGSPAPPAALPAWAADHAYTFGQIIQDSNGNAEMCVVAGTSGTPTAPTWLTAPGADLQDGTAYWRFLGPYAAVAWAATTAYTVGQIIADSNGNSQVCAIAGTSGASAPAWLTAPGPALKEGTCAWLFCGGAYGAYFAGATEGATTSTLTPKFEEMGADQVSSPIDVVETADAFEIDLTVKQSDLANLQNFFPPGTFSIGTDATQPSGAQAYEQINFGGIIPVNKIGVAVISARRDAPTKFVISHLYQAYQAEAIKLPFARGKETTYSVKFKGIADSSRPNGDQVGMIWRQV
jgi:hypothetical protein